MEIINELSSQIGDKTEKSNKLVADKCIKNPVLLSYIADTLANPDRKIAADAAEVLTFVSSVHPDLVVPYISNIGAVLDHKDTKVRWEATHTLAQVAETAPESVKGFIDSLNKMALTDKSKIVQDYAIVAIGNYGSSSKNAAQDILPLLSRILEIQGNRQAVRVIEGMSKLFVANETLRNDIIEATRSQSDSEKSSVKKAYGKLVKQLG